MVDTIQSYFWQLCHPTRLQTPKSLTNPLFDTWALSEIVENQRIQGPGEIEALSIYILFCRALKIPLPLQ